ncbi:MAG: hypothetical protein M3501_08390 [Actinomycetota bacterium]|nr:hypothetical protein [Actinomycetota bacterium]MDQ3351962.1 hypothetical protein [Actinomycetota bacterium]
MAHISAGLRPRLVLAGVGVVLALLVAVVLVIASGDDTQAPTTPTDPPVTLPRSTTVPPSIDVTAQAIVYRTDQAVGGRFRVKLTNTGDDEFTVTGVRLESAGFETLAFTPHDTLYSPSERTDLVTPFGDVRCEPGDALDPTDAAIRFVTASGSEGEVRVPLESIYEAIPKLYERECDKAFIEESAVIAITDPIEESGEGFDARARATLRITRAGSDEAIAVDDIRGSVLYSITGELPAMLAPGEDEIDIPIELRGTRCDGHALGETKQPFVYPIRLRIGDDFESSYDIPVNPSQQDQLWTFLVSRTCRLE